MDTDLRDFLREIAYDIEVVDDYIKDKAWAEAWTTLEDIADKITDLIYEVKKVWKSNGGIGGDEE